MFNLFNEINRLRQLQHDKIHGISDKPKHHNPKVQQVDGMPYEINAQQESMAMSSSFHNHSLMFGRRLSKRKGQYHRPGGGFAGCVIKGG